MNMTRVLVPSRRRMIDLTEAPHERSTVQHSVYIVSKLEGFPTLVIKLAEI